MSYRFAHRTFRAALVGVFVMAGAAEAADGLQPPAVDQAWPVWQTRISLIVNQPLDGGARSLRQASWLGDYYLQRHGDDDAAARWRGGFRATSGLVVGGLGGLPGLSTQSRVWSSSLLTVRDDPGEVERAAWPYIGFGYSGLAPRGGWGFSADFGIALRQPAAAPELGRALLGLRGWESALRRFEPLPMVQLGVRYSF
jgi:hypothetical protein